MTDVVAEIAAAGKEQAEGIAQLVNTMSQMDQVTQRNAANAEEIAASSEYLTSQSLVMNQMVSDLGRLVGVGGQKELQQVATGHRSKEISRIYHTKGEENRKLPEKIIKPEEVIPFSENTEEFEDF